MRIKTLDRILYIRGLYSSWKRGNGYKPRSVILLMTSRCNVRCMMCNIWRLPKDRPEGMNQDLSTEDYTTLLRELSGMGTREVFFSGGEPLLRKDISGLVRYAKQEMGFEHVELVTNGTLMTETIAEELVASGLDLIDFSIDGPTPEVHDKLRGVDGAWHRAVRGVDLIKRAKNKLNVEKPSISIAYIVSSISSGHIEQMIDLKSELGYDILHLYPVLTKTNEMATLLLTDSDLGSLERRLDVLEDKLRNVGLPTSTLLPLLRMCKDKEGAEEGRYAESINRRVLCFTPWEFSIIDPFGNVSPCCSACSFFNLSESGDRALWGTDHAIMGNIRNSTFRQIWNGDEFGAFRGQLKEFPSFPFCAWCSERYVNSAARDILLTALLKDRRLLPKMAFSLVRQRLGRSKGFEWDFLYR